MEPRPLVLLSNDDGHRAQGLRGLAIALRRAADVVICAPESEQSTSSHALTLSRPLRLRRVDEGVFAVDGTPADCVYVALHAKERVLPRRPDLVVSGINHGLNLGSDVFYSGTVAAAREAALRGIPSMAISADRDADPVESSNLGAALALALLALAPAPRIALFNVNIPPGRGWSVVPTRLGARLYEDVVEFRNDPRHVEYLWIGGATVQHGFIAGSDTEAYDRGDASITPLRLDLTAEAGLSTAEEIVESLAARAANLKTVANAASSARRANNEEP